MWSTGIKHYSGVLFPLSSLLQQKSTHWSYHYRKCSYCSVMLLMIMQLPRSHETCLQGKGSCIHYKRSTRIATSMVRVATSMVRIAASTTEHTNNNSASTTEHTKTLPLTVTIRHSLQTLPNNWLHFYSSSTHPSCYNENRKAADASVP